MIIVDRFEGEYAVCEVSQEGQEETYRNIPRVLLPRQVREGDCLRQTSQGDWEIDQALTAQRRTSIAKRMADLYSRA